MPARGAAAPASGLLSNSFRVPRPSFLSQRPSPIAKRPDVFQHANRHRREHARLLARRHDRQPRPRVRHDERRDARRCDGHARHPATPERGSPQLEPDRARMTEHASEAAHIQEHQPVVPHLDPRRKLARQIDERASGRRWVRNEDAGEERSCAAETRDSELGARELSTIDCRLTIGEQRHDRISSEFQVPSSENAPRRQSRGDRDHGTEHENTKGPRRHESTKKLRPPVTPPQLFVSSCLRGMP